MIDPTPGYCLGDKIVFTGTTNLPAYETITTRIYEAFRRCTKGVPRNNSVDGCYGDQIPLLVIVKPGYQGINTWSREVNTSTYDFMTGEYQIDVGEPSRGVWNSSGFMILKRSEPSGPWITIDPIPHHYLGDTIAFHGKTNLPPGEMIETAVYSGEFVPCPKSTGDCLGNVTPCCGGFTDYVSVISGPCGINTWSWDVSTAQHGFRADGVYIISATARYGAVENTSIFGVSGIPKPSLTLSLPANDSGGYTLRFSG